MRVLYFLENNWVFGKIFNELIKFLHPDIDGDLLSWGRTYSRQETDLLRDKYDLYFSTPVGCFFLHKTYGWPLEKCFAHAHSEFDIFDALRRYPAEYFTKLAGYAAVSPPIAKTSISAGVPREPTLLPVGVTTANYAKPMSQTVERVGYFGRMARVDHNQPDLKRGYLARRVVERANVMLYHRENMHFLTADQLYKKVDLVLFCSTTEGNPYVAIEAAAAGIPTLGTDVGVFPALVKAGAGVLLPFGEDEFVAEAAAAIRALQDDPALYARMSRNAREVSASFDWTRIRAFWLQAFAAAAS